jgi:hypothetical protein
MVMRHTSLTLAIGIMLARESGLNQTSPIVLTVPTWELNCTPPVWMQRGLSLALMFDSKCQFFKTDTVDWLSRRIHVSGVILRLRW